MTSRLMKNEQPGVFFQKITHCIDGPLMCQLVMDLRARSLQEIRVFRCLSLDPGTPAVGNATRGGACPV